MLSGVPVAYDNIRVVGELGDIYDDDQGFIHFNIEADFVIFTPKKGKKLVAEVVERQYSYGELRNVNVNLTVGATPDAGILRKAKPFVKD